MTDKAMVQQIDIKSTGFRVDNGTVTLQITIEGITSEDECNKLAAHIRGSLGGAVAEFYTALLEAKTTETPRQ